MSQITTRTRLEVSIASSVGTTFEYYDFGIAGFAAGTVWPALFFTGMPEAVAYSLSLVVWGITFLSRPIGAFLFGHFGDRIGRRDLLIWSLTLMALAVLFTAFLPPFASIGIAAPILLTAFRFMQGIGIGGEWGGAISWPAEFCKDNPRRSVFWTGIVGAGIGWGNGLGAFLFAITLSLLGQDAFASYGWRVIFGLGAVLLVVGGLIRWKLTDSPLFRALVEKKSVEREPSITVLKKHWKQILPLAAMFMYAPAAFSGVVTPYSFFYLGQLSKGLLSGLTLWAVAMAGLGAGFFVIVTATLGCYFPRKRILEGCIVASALLVYPLFLLIQTLNVALIYFGYTIFVMAAFGEFGVYNQISANQFPTKLRYSGVGLSSQIGGAVIGVILAVVSPFWLYRFGVAGAAPYVMGTFVAICVLALAGTILIKDPDRLPE